jgi:hypothetical protein
MINSSIKCITTETTKKEKSDFVFDETYPRMKRADNAGIRRRLFDSSTEANANLAAVNVKKDSVVLVKIRCVICK